MPFTCRAPPLKTKELAASTEANHIILLSKQRNKYDAQHISHLGTQTQKEHGGIVKTPKNDLLGVACMKLKT